MATVDAAIDQSGITFSTSTFYQGDTARVYARVRNVGESDVTATVIFYRSDEVLGKAQAISLRAGGAPEEVFVDFLVPDGSFNIRAVIQGTDPLDEDASNNEATTPLYTPIADADRDGVLDAKDNCVDDENAAQADTDDDGVGDACDARDDRPVAVAVVAEEREEALVMPTVVMPVPAAKVAATVVPASVGQTAIETAEDATVPRPTSSYGIFTNAQASETSTGVAEGQSFFRMDNPWLSVLVVSLAIAMLAALVTIVYLRSRHHESLPDEGDV